MNARGVTVRERPSRVVDALAPGGVEWIDEVDGVLPRDSPCSLLWDYRERDVFEYNPESGRISGRDADDLLDGGRLGTVYEPVSGGDVRGDFNLVMMAYDLREVDEPVRQAGDPVHLASPGNAGLEVYTAPDRLVVEAPAPHLDIFATMRDLPAVEPMRQYVSD